MLRRFYGSDSIAFTFVSDELNGATIANEGKIQKPEAFFFYQKSSINYDWQDLKQDFLPKILESVNGSPF